MTRLARALSLAIGLAAPLPALAKDPPVSYVAPQRLAVATPAGVVGQLPLLLSQDWSAPLPAVTRAVITVHGLTRDVENYQRAAEKALAASGIDPATVLLVAPQFLDDGDVEAHQLPQETLRWSHTGWEGGDDAHGPAPISSFAAFDAILAKLADRSLFPALAQVVVAGHSGGGQVVQRYAVALRGDAALIKAGVKDVHYVVANPSSYVYFSPERPAGKGFARPADGCPEYDKWKYGMHGLPPYMAGRDAAALEAAYVARPVTYLLGTADTDPAHPALDKSCAAEAQGPDRHSRGVAYLRYLQWRHPTGLSHRQVDVPGVGHSGDKMFGSTCGVAAVYGTAGCDGR